MSASKHCVAEGLETPGCEAKLDHGEDPISELFPIVDRILMNQNAIAPLAERKRFVEVLERSIRQRDEMSRRWKQITSDTGDIIALINTAVAASDMDEVIWRCFLAAHFGRTSASNDPQARSASRLLCAFGDTPVWTWETVVDDPQALEDWLSQSQEQLSLLRFGNHRKYESHKPRNLWSVISSFISLAADYDGPANLISRTPEEDSADGFHVLYRRLRPLSRFGRTGYFDFLVLMLDLGIISCEPKKGYLAGSTGPMKGARQLWGKLGSKRLESMGADLACQLRVSPIVIEDALCNWQK